MSLLTPTFLYPTLEEFESTLQRVIKESAQIGRIKVVVPREYSHQDEIVVVLNPQDQTPMTLPHEYHEENPRNWSVIEELQMNYRGSALGPHVFMTLRFDQESEGEIIIMDFLRLM